MTSVVEWCIKWGVPQEALTELEQITFAHIDATIVSDAGSEGGVQSRIRQNAPYIGQALWRNNSGAMYNDSGALVRFGLANTSAKLNRVFKSSDLIGITAVLVKPCHVGLKFGLFTAVETKDTDWTKPRNDRDRAQLSFLNKVISLGGIGMFSTDHHQVETLVTGIRK